MTHYAYLTNNDISTKLYELEQTLETIQYMMKEVVTTLRIMKQPKRRKSDS